MVKSFKLVNPRIIGSLNTNIEGSDATDAAHKAWATISEHITGNVPQFTFTLEDTTDKKLFSFQVTEAATGKYADYTISPVEMKLTQDQEATFRKELSRLDKINRQMKNKQHGGDKNKKRYLDDSSSSDSDDDISVYDKLKLFNAINKPKPIIYWWYTPLVYDIDRFYVPTFVAPLMPYVEINLSSAFFG